MMRVILPNKRLFVPKMPAVLRIWDEEALEYVEGAAGPISTSAGVGGIFNDPLHWWKLSDFSGASAPDSGSSVLNGTLVGSPGTQSGPAGTPYSGSVPSFVKASGQAVIFTTATMFDWNSGPFTWTGWVYISDNTALDETGATSDQYYFLDDRLGNGTNYFLLHNRSGANPGALVAATSSGLIGAATTAMNVPSATWTHLGITNSTGGNGGTHAIYVGGNLVSSITGTAGDNSFDLVASQIAHGNDVRTLGGLTGALASVRIYNRALSAVDFSSLFTAGG